MRALVFLLLILPAALHAEQPRNPAERSVNEIGRLLGNGIRVTLAITARASVPGTADASPGRKIAHETAVEAHGLMQGAYGNVDGFSILDPPSPGRTRSLQPPSRQKLYADGANYALEINVVAAAGPGGRISMSQTDSTLVRLVDGKVMSHDVAWATRSSSGAVSLFLNGVRVR